MAAILFQEVQRLPVRRSALALAVPPTGMLVLLIGQVVLGHSWGNHPMSNASVVTWTVILWLFYFRLITARMVTRIRDGELRVTLSGIRQSRRVVLRGIQSAETITYDPERDYGGYGFRSNSLGKAYLAGGNRGVRLRVVDGATLVIGSQRPDELAGILDKFH